MTTEAGSALAVDSVHGWWYALDGVSLNELESRWTTVHYITGRMAFGVVTGLECKTMLSVIPVALKTDGAKLEQATTIQELMTMQCV
jgi:hypothetical protein